MLIAFAGLPATGKSTLSRELARELHIPGHKLPAWQDLTTRDYDVWTRSRIVVDTAGKTVARTLDELRRKLASRSRTPLPVGRRFRQGTPPRGLVPCLPSKPSL